MKRSYENMRYNDNTRGKGKHKKSANKSVRRALVGSIALFMLVGFSAEYTRTDQTMTREEGIEITEVYSPSGGLNTITHGEKQHTAKDVINRMIEDARNKVFSFEKDHEETDEMNSSMGRG